MRVGVCLSGHERPNHGTDRRQTWSPDTKSRSLGNSRITPEAWGRFEAKIEVQRYIYRMQYQYSNLWQEEGREEGQ